MPGSLLTEQLGVASVLTGCAETICACDPCLLPPPTCRSPPGSSVLIFGPSLSELITIAEAGCFRRMWRAVNTGGGLARVVHRSVSLRHTCGWHRETTPVLSLHSPRKPSRGLQSDRDSAQTLEQKGDEAA